MFCRYTFYKQIQFRDEYFWAKLPNFPLNFCAICALTEFRRTLGGYGRVRAAAIIIPYFCFVVNR